MTVITFTDFEKVVRLHQRYRDRYCETLDPRAMRMANNAARQAVELLTVFVGQADTKNTDAALLRALDERRCG